VRNTLERDSGGGGVAERSWAMGIEADGE